MSIFKPGRYKIKFNTEIPSGVEFFDLMDFVEEWMECGGGCRHPDDPLFGSLEDVSVISVTPSRKRSPK